MRPSRSVPQSRRRPVLTSSRPSSRIAEAAVMLGVAVIGGSCGRRVEEGGEGEGPAGWSEINAAHVVAEIEQVVVSDGDEPGGDLAGDAAVGGYVGDDGRLRAFPADGVRRVHPA